MLMSLFSLQHYTALYLSVSFFILILNIKLNPLFFFFSPIMMISFCRKSVHSLLSLTATPTTTTSSNSSNSDQLSSVNPKNNPNPIWSKGLIDLVTPATKDPGGIGLLDAAVDGLASCTESLGSESSDGSSGDGDCELSSSAKVIPARKRSSADRSAKKYPPPLPSLDRNGKPSFFFRPVRKDGRLELTEVKINRPEILRAYRGNGRLRLSLVTDDDNLDCIEEEEEELGVEENGNGHDNDENEVEDRALGLGFRRCNEEMNHHRSDLWRRRQDQEHQRCVTTT